MWGMKVKGENTVQIGYPVGIGGGRKASGTNPGVCPVAGIGNVSAQLNVAFL
jgi:hypothetical protein